MKPPMRQKAIIETPLLDEHGQPKRNGYDQPVTVPVTIQARVQRKMKVIRKQGGVEFRSNLEIDLPPSFVPVNDSHGTFEVPGEGMVRAIIGDSEAIYNLSGSRVEYRTVYANG